MSDFEVNDMGKVLRSSGILRSVQWLFPTHISRQPIGPKMSVRNYDSTLL
jgi:hypothetical protein